MRQEDCLLFYILNIFWKDSRWAHNHFWSRIWILIALITTFFDKLLELKAQLLSETSGENPRNRLLIESRAKSHKKSSQEIDFIKVIPPLWKISNILILKFFLFFQGSYRQIPSKYTINSSGCLTGLQKDN